MAENGERPTVEGAVWGEGIIEAEIRAREEFGAALGRAWADIPALREARDFSAFCRMLSEIPAVWFDTDFIVLSAAWKAIRAA